MSGMNVREMLVEAMGKGAKVFGCQMRAKMNGIGASDLIAGAMLLVAEDLIDPGYQVKSW